MAYTVDPLTASKVVLLDSIISNIDRTAKNTNLLHWNKELWIIDNGASFYFHHNWDTWENHLTRSFPLIKDHVLLKSASHLKEASQEITDLLSQVIIEDIISKIPEEWLLEESNPLSPNEIRAAYATYLNAKLNNIDTLVKEAEDAR